MKSEKLGSAIPVVFPAISPIKRYLFAVAMVLLGTLARELVTPAVGRTALPFIFFFPAIAATAWFSGFGPGILATILATLIAAGRYLTGGRPFAIQNLGEVTALAAFVFGCAIIIIALERMHRSHARLVEEISLRELTEIERSRAQHLLATTLESIGDGVIVTDAAGCVTFLNPEAERLTGWTSGDAAGNPLPAVFRIVRETDRSIVENPVEKVIRMGSRVGMANHTLLLSKDGTETHIDDSAAPIRTTPNALAGVVLVFRDVSDQRKAEH